MKKIVLALILLNSMVFAQNNNLLRLDGAYIVLDGGTSSTPIYLVVDQNNPNGIVRNSGHIHSENQFNIVKWFTGNDTGNFVFPFGVGGNATDFIPFVFHKTAGNSSVSISTWATNTQNTPKPLASNVAAVTNMLGITDSVAYAIDRFWDIQANATTADLTFSYRGVENTTTTPTGVVQAQHWNGSAWDSPVNAGSIGITSGIGTAGPFNGQNTFSPWVLITACTDTVTQNITICQGDSIVVGSSVYATAGTFIDTLTNTLGCDSIVTTVLTVNPVPVNTTTATICQGDSILLGGAYQTTAGTYQDTIPNGAANGCDSIIVTTLTVNPVPVNTTTASICQGDSILLGGVYQTTAGTYQDTIPYGSANGCDSIIVTTLTINPAPVVSISGDTAVCAGKQITLTAGGAITYQWNTGETTAVITVTPSANTTYQVIGFNGSCSDTANTTITLLLPPTATASPDTLLEEGTSVTLTAGGGGTYLWYPSDYLSCDTCANPEATPEVTTEYCVVVTASNTCSDTACITLQVEKICGEVFVPNILTPNGDGQHDRLEIFGNCLQNFTFTIYNRWGEVVFETTDLSETWDGTYKGQAVNNAVFHYLLRGTLISGKEVEKYGTITLVK